MSTKQCFNPYMGAHEYVPDGEPHVFGDRVYVYGSHDRFNGATFCINDYICWSAPVTDLTDWRYEGVIYKKSQDPANSNGRMVLYAPDVTKGPDGRYYLYYVMDKINIVSVAVCDTPAGEYEFYGYVHYEDGTKLGEKEGDEPQFDPAVITEGDTTYMYTGFCGRGDKSRSGAQCTVLGADMLTIKKAPVIVVPGSCYGEGTGFEGHAFFEASSIRKKDGIYYFVYSSEVMHELAYATSESPDKDFVYRGVIVSNSDIGISSYKPADRPTAFGANNHGGFEAINGKYYIFYHRHTNGHWFSRQGCAEEIHFTPEGLIPQVEITSCGLNGGPLKDTEEYSSYIACNMFDEKKEIYVNPLQPHVTQDGADGDDNAEVYIENINEGQTVGFKYFDLKNVKGMYTVTCGYCHGYFEVRTSIDGPVLGKIASDSANFFERNEARFDMPDGVSAVYLTWKGGSCPRFKAFGFIH